MKTNENGSHLTSLNAKHLRAIDALLREPTAVAAARASNIVSLRQTAIDPTF
jgi:hypothetical protein